MEKIQLPYCDLILKESHAILTMQEGTSVTVENAAEITDHLENHYNGQKFIFISDRKYDHEIDLNVYKGKILKNMIGYAIVSDKPEEVKRAYVEQPLWDEAFTFFKKLEDAEDWARSFFD